MGSVARTCSMGRSRIASVTESRPMRKRSELFTEIGDSATGDVEIAGAKDGAEEPERDETWCAEESVPEIGGTADGDGRGGSVSVLARFSQKNARVSAVRMSS